MSTRTLTRRQFLGRGLGALALVAVVPSMAAQAFAEAPDARRARMLEALRGLDTRIGAVELRRLAGAEAEALLESIALDRAIDGRVRLRAVASLTVLATQDAVSRLQAVERSPGLHERLRWHARHGAVAAMGQRDPTLAVALAAAYQRTDAPLLREAAVRGLRALPAEAALPAAVQQRLAALLDAADKDPDARVQRAAGAVRRARARMK